MKDAALNLKLSQHLHDAVKKEAEKNNVTMAAYVRAVLAHHVFSGNNKSSVGEEWLIIDKDGDVLKNI